MCRSDSCCPYGMSQDGRDMNHTGMPPCVPFLATARFLPRLDSFLFGVFQHQISVGDDPARQTVGLTRAIGQINTIWAERWWTIVQGVWQVDWERSRKSSMTMDSRSGGV